ncbi:aminoglycoside phosphotransferase family protein [Mesobacillus maritimus]|uniref:phosphotransferase n=1 Tax=Mesobacillus maritimus TaxID=1643336 RepID=UPI00203CE086|nr:phosphotransferase [Mesobacillus maritimus]MCM3587689.1 aminoglycoside phosphotransferase family protein [Mesobacillus maritimus]MCM3669934.1 aminoglycoside phosphotransferase family protein [Mesobacillus maritimus]
MECHVKKMTKAMNINFHPGRDDFVDRLFSFLSKNLPVEVINLKRIREHVFFVEAKPRPFILKGYNNLSKLVLQQEFTNELKKAGFNHTYEYYRFTEVPLYFENNYYGCISYLDPHQYPFSFKTQAEREEGLEKLIDYHAVTKKLVSSYDSLLPTQNLIKKWSNRLRQFKNNQAIVNYYVPKNITYELNNWANLALRGMRKHQLLFESSNPVILHGDVAHHNFFRVQTGELFLIDFDLISKGPASFDLLQYANRILPFMNWSLESLVEMEGLSDYINDKSFVYGLIYPSDVFREWNRVVKLKSYYDPSRVAPLMEITVNQYNQRKNFIEKLLKLV